jgi:hypothetical protein
MAANREFEDRLLLEQDGYAVMLIPSEISRALFEASGSPGPAVTCREWFVVLHVGPTRPLCFGSLLLNQKRPRGQVARTAGPRRNSRAGSERMDSHR